MLSVVHIEIVDSLETDSSLNGLRHFVNRQGNPKTIRSDNGTNFKGGEHKLEWNGILGGRSMGADDAIN